MRSVKFRGRGWDSIKNDYIISSYSYELAIDLKGMIIGGRCGLAVPGSSRFILPFPPLPLSWVLFAAA